MRIALVGYEANVPQRVGSNQYAFELLKALEKIDRKSCYLVYLPNSPLADLPRERENWQYRVIGPSRLWNLFGLPRALLKEKPRPDLVFVPGHYAPPLCLSPLVVSIMDLGYRRRPQDFTLPIYGKLRLWTTFSLRKATHVFAISQSTKDDIIKYEKIAPEKITVTYPGFDKDKFRIQNSELRIKGVKEKYGINGDYILSLSTLKPNKNIGGLLEAFRLMSGLPITLVVAGRKGWLFESIFAKVKKLGLEDRVIFTGFVDEEDKPSLMAGARAFVMPSFWEGFGIPVIEAMAVGTPVAVSNTGSLPEIVGEAGIIVDPYSPADIARGIKKVISDKRIRDKMIKRGLERVKKFSWEKCAQKTFEVLKKVVNK